MGHSVKVLTYAIAENNGFRKQGDFLICEYVFQGVPVVSIKHKVIPPDVSFRIYDPSMEEILETIFSKEEFDIIHVCHPMRTGSIMKIAKKRKIPVILTLTDFWLMCPRGIAVTAKGELCSSPEGGVKCAAECYEHMPNDKTKTRFREAEEFAKNADVIISPTYFLAGMFGNVFNRDVKVIRHGIDYRDIRINNRMKQKGDSVTYGYIGTVLPHKGVHLIVEAMKMIRSQNIKVKIYGNYFYEKEYYEKLKKMVEGDSRVEFLGQYEDGEMQHIMNDMDCTIVPSIWWENSPLTVLTSLAHKVPVITINIGGAAELIKDGVNGFNFEIGNSRSLASIMQRIAENPELLNTIKSNIVRPPRNEDEAFEYELLMQCCIELSLCRFIGFE
ncbi:MAG: glycosyltransferase involved in cell wall biosynthesis [Candidatus Nitrosomirales archaeon]|jgi:glycosyltransferase involved in cell wall biosynthesis